MRKNKELAISVISLKLPSKWQKQDMNLTIWVPKAVLLIIEKYFLHITSGSMFVIKTGKKSTTYHHFPIPWLSWTGLSSWKSQGLLALSFALAFEKRKSSVPAGGEALLCLCSCRSIITSLLLILRETRARLQSSWSAPQPTSQLPPVWELLCPTEGCGCHKVTALWLGLTEIWFLGLCFPVFCLLESQDRQVCTHLWSLMQAVWLFSFLFRRL